MGNKEQLAISEESAWECEHNCTIKPWQRVLKDAGLTESVLSEDDNRALQEVAPAYHASLAHGDHVWIDNFGRINRTRPLNRLIEAIKAGKDVDTRSFN